MICLSLNCRYGAIWAFRGRSGVSCGGPCKSGRPRLPGRKGLRVCVRGGERGARSVRARTNAVRDNARARAPSRGPGMAWARDGVPTQERPTAKFAPRAPRTPRPALVTAPGPRAPPIQYHFCPCLDSTTVGAGRLQIQSRRARRRRGAVHPARLAARRRPGSRHGCARKPAICATVHCGWVVVERGGGGGCTAATVDLLNRLTSPILLRSSFTASIRRARVGDMPQCRVARRRPKRREGNGGGVGDLPQCRVARRRPIAGEGNGGGTAAGWGAYFFHLCSEPRFLPFSGYGFCARCETWLYIRFNSYENS